MVGFENDQSNIFNVLVPVLFGMCPDLILSKPSFSAMTESKIVAIDQSNIHKRCCMPKKVLMFEQFHSC